MMADFDRIREALQFIPAHDRDTWVHMGMAIKSELNESGFTLWDDWGQNADSYSVKDARDVWKSIKPGGKVTIASLFHKAKANGWQPSKPYTPPTPEQRAALAAERKAAIEAAAEIERQQREAAKAKAARMWNEEAHDAAADHPYLVKKGIQPEGVKQLQQTLLLPIRSGGELVNLQLIGEDGSKRFLTGGQVKGASLVLGKLAGAAEAILCEGWATGVSLRAATGLPVVVAFNAGNLPEVAGRLAKSCPELALIVAGDNDASQTGQKAAEKAAATHAKARWCCPAFTPEQINQRQQESGKPPSDFNDLDQLAGLEEVAKQIKTAAQPAKQEASASRELVHESALDVGLIRASDIVPEPQQWLWNGWLAAGKMHVFGGAPGTGKTTISMGLAATVSTGGYWPDGSQSIAGNVVIWSGEDDPADTLIPRLIMSGADLSRIYFITDIREGNERRSFDPARDMEPLRRKLVEVGGVKLLIVDPIVSAISGDSHKNAEVRRGLQPLVDLASSMRCALLGITHFSKGTSGANPVERLTGSLAFAALARVVLVAATHEEGGENGRAVRVFCRAKSNIGPDSGGFEYNLHQGELKEYQGIVASSVMWGGALEGTARDLLATAEATGGDGESGAMAEAKRYLIDMLSQSSVPVKELKADSTDAGHSWATIKRAASELKVEKQKDGMNGGWVWRLPGHEAAEAILAKAAEASLEQTKVLNNSEDAQQEEVRPFEEFEHLQDESGAVEVEI